MKEKHKNHTTLKTHWTGATSAAKSKAKSR
jgi:hypothetical protein